MKNSKRVAAAWAEKKYILCTSFPPAILRNYAYSVHSVHILDRCPQFLRCLRTLTYMDRILTCWSVSLQQKKLAAASLKPWAERRCTFFNDLTGAKYSTCEGNFLALMHGVSFSFATWPDCRVLYIQYSTFGLSPQALTFCVSDRTRVH